MSKKKEKYKDRIYNNLESYRLNSQNNKFYSMQRIDIIIISLSTGSIIVLLNYTDKIVLYNCFYMSLLYFLALIIFSLSIGSNIISQWYSHKVHQIESAWASKQMEVLNKVCKENNVEDTSNKNKITCISNKVSVWSLAIAVAISFILLGVIIF